MRPTFHRVCELGALILVCILAPIAVAQANDPAPRLALVSTETNRDIDNLITLAEARLSAKADITLVDRRAIDKVLAEQKLSRTGLVAEERAVKVGKLLGVQLFAIVETDFRHKKVLGVVVFDATTGVRIWDAPLTETDLDKAVDGLSNAVKAAVAKHARLDKGLKTVCVSAVRNVDLPSERDAFCDTVAFLLERGLANAPDLALLERKQLAKVVEERDLPTDSPLAKLKASVYRIELQFQRANETDVRAAALLYDGAGKKLAEKQVTGSFDGALNLADTLVPEVAKLLKIAPPAKPADREIEGMRFARESAYLRIAREEEKALIACEASLALFPNNYNQRAQRVTALWKVGSGVLRDAYSTLKAIPEEEIQEAFRKLIRAAEEQEVIEAAWRQNPSVLDYGPHYSISYYAGLDKRVKIRLTKTKELMAQLSEVEARIYKARLDHTLSHVDTRQEFEALVSSMPNTGFYQVGGHYDERSPEFQKLWKEHARAVIRLALKYQNPPPDLVTAPKLYEIFRLVEVAKLDIPEMDRYRKTMLETGGPIMQVLEKDLQLDLAFLRPDISMAECTKRIHDHRLLLEQIITKHGQDSYMVRLACYEAFSGVLNWVPRRTVMTLDHPIGKEFVAFCEFMVAQNDYHPFLAVNLYQRLAVDRSREAEGQVLELLDRFTTVLKSPKSQFFRDAHNDGPVEPYVGFELQRLAKRKREITSRYPELLAKRVNPWGEVQELIDVFNIPRGIVRLSKPFVRGEDIYVAVLGQERSDPATRYAQLIRYTLPDGKRTLLGRLYLDTGYEPPTDQDRKMHAGHPYFGEGEKQRVLTDAYLGEAHYVLGTRDKGVLIFPLDGGEVVHLNTGNHLPSNRVQAVACQDGQVFAAVGDREREGSALLAYNLQSKKITLLGSSRRADVQSPFDNQLPWLVRQITADPDRHQMLLLVDGNSRNLDIGVWKLDTRSHKLRLLQKTPQINEGWLSAPWEGNVLFAGNIQTYLIDLTTGKSEAAIHRKEARHAVWDPRLHEMLALTRKVGLPDRLVPNHSFHDGWLWSASTFTRMSLNGKTRQNLAGPRKDTKFAFYPHECFQYLGDGRMLLADAHGMWVADLKD